MGISRIIILLLLCSVFGFAKKKDLGLGMQGFGAQNVANGVNWGPEASISAKRFIAKNEAVDGSLYLNFEHFGFSLDVDYLLHNYKLIPVTVGKTSLYYGVGGNLGYNEWSGVFISARMPVGLDYEFKAPFDVYGEIVPALRVFKKPILELQLAIGGRYWF